VSEHRPEEASGQRAYRFGPFVVDLARRQLWRDGHLVAITSKTFDVLVVLIERREHTVSKDELLARVWPDTVVNENNLARQISSLRRALGQRPDEHDYLVTIPGHGYRFVAALHDVDEAPEPVHPPAPSPADDGPVALEAHRIGPSAAPARRRWIPTAVVSAAAIVVVAVTADRALRPDDAGPPARRALQRITYDAAAVPRDAAWSPDGQRLVYTSDRAGNADLWIQRLGDPDPVRLTMSQDAESSPEWSPDGRSIVFRSERDGGGVFVMPATGGAARVIATFGYEPRWSPDGAHVLLKGSTVLPDVPSLYVVDLDGTPPRPVRPDVLGQFTSLQAAWHPDGRRISVWGTTRQREARVLTISLEGGAPATVDIAPRVRQDLSGIVPCRFVWAPSRRYVYFEGRVADTANVWRITVDPASDRWIDGPERLTTGSGEETHVALSPDGERLVFTAKSSRTRLWSFPFDPALGRTTGAPHPLSEGGAGEVDFDARADGSKVAYRTVRAGRSELWERSVDKGQVRLLLSSASWAMAKPLWSPDGARLAFVRWNPRDKDYGVAVVNADGTGQRLVTLPDRVEMQGSDWSKDGDAIIGSCRFSRADRYSTCLVQVSSVSDSGAPPVKVIASDARRNLFNQRYSPDQRWISFLAHDLSSASTSTVYVAPATGGGWRAITDGTWFDDKPRWSPDGRVLYFVSNRTGVRNVWGRRFDAATGLPVGEAFPVTSFRTAEFVPADQAVQMDIAITPTQLLLPMSESRSDLWLLDQVDR
jgi:Tol biopolymer transport system component/DNA-binding winged helix-turn-helix (wHTH) protein